MDLTPELSVIEGAYLRDLLAQPPALADTLAGLRAAPPWEIRAASYAKIVLTGMGSSLHALHPLQLRLVRAGHTAMRVETAELIHAQADLLDDRTLLVVVSQSGRSAETVQLLELLQAREKRPFVIGVTNTPGSPLASSADAVVWMRAGQEFSVSCKTYLATLVALEWLGGALCGEDPGAVLRELKQAAPAAQGYLAEWRRHVEQLMGELRGVRDLFITGRGASLAAAGTGGLIVKESAHFHAEGMSSPAFRHGPFEMISAEVFVMVFAGDPATAALNAALVRDVRAAGGRAALVGDAEAPGVFRLPAVPACVRPVVEMLPVQMVSLALGALAGREPGRFERGSKVTTVA
jgi:glucosamine--fructose-6-phosphate aminotransferase (isomerizing)